MLRRKCGAGSLGWLLLVGCFLYCLPEKSIADHLSWISQSSVATPTVDMPQGARHSFDHQNFPVKTTFSISLGTRWDDLDWSIAGANEYGQPINVRSELEWDNVQSYQLRLDNRTQIGGFFYFRGYFDYATIKDGTIRDSDYNGNGRTEEYSRSISTSAGDQLWDLSGGIGYPFHLDRNGASYLLAPLFGLSLHKQNFRITEGYQVLTEPGGPELGELEGLNSSFEAKWLGPWLGLDLRCCMAAKHTRLVPMEWGLSLEYHFQTRYRAKANWNLRDDFEHPVSFRQEADARGICLTGDWRISPWQRWDIQFIATLQTWETEDGTLRFFNADGTSDAVRLNEVQWTTHSLMAGLTYHFF
jgi:hypothetical protein